MYVPGQYANMPPALIIGILQRNYPQLNHKYKLIRSDKFITEGPNFQGGRSRIGDTILLIEGSDDFMKGLELFPSKFLFQMSPTWKLSIRGGRRSDQTKAKESAEIATFTEQFKNAVLVASAEATISEAKRVHSRPL